MSPRAEREMQVREAQFRIYGEPVVVPIGPPVVGVFDALGKPPGAAFGSEVGLAFQLGNEPNPAVLLWASDAAALKRNDALLIDEQGFTLVDKHPLPGSVVHCTLMPAAASGVDSTARYR